MNFKRMSFFLFVLGLGCVLFSQTGFSEDKSKGFYAGPLSDTPKNIQRKADQKKSEDSLAAQKAIAVDVSPPVKVEPFNFKSWLRKVFNDDR